MLTAPNMIFLSDQKYWVCTDSHFINIMGIFRSGEETDTIRFVTETNADETHYTATFGDRLSAMQRLVKNEPSRSIVAA